jgi:V/A-type H+-transporting ATPase subunit E
MGFAELLEAIEAKGKDEKEKIVSRSEKTASRSIQEAETKAKEITQSILEGEDPGLEVTKTRIRGESELRKKRSLAQAKNRILEEVFEKVRENLAKVRERKDYESILQKLAKEVLTGEDLIVYVHERDVSLVQKILATEGLRGEVRPVKDCLGGLIVESEKGAVSLHNTVESRLEKRRDSLIEKVNKIIFEGPR